MAVSNSDLQHWQSAVQGINALGKNDLTQEEWQALSTLNNCLSSGDFVSDASRNAYTLLSNNLANHSHNQELQKHLYDFLMLCYNQSCTAHISENTTKQSGQVIVEKKEKQYSFPKIVLLGQEGAFKASFANNLKKTVIYSFAAAALAGAIYALSIAPQTNMPSYVTAVIVGALAGIALLRKNQNGEVREKFAFLCAVTAGIYMYFTRGEQISGGYAFAWTFVCVGAVVAFLGKNKPNLFLWLAEVVPTVLLFLAFERFGGAISGFGAKDIVWGNLASVRYVEAFKIFLLFLLFQSFANNAVTAQFREAVRSKLAVLFYGTLAAAFVLLLYVFLNPFELSMFDTFKSELTAFSQPVRTNADVFDKDGRNIGRATKTPHTSPLLSKHIPGYLASAYEFSYDGDFDKANITFEYDAGLGKVGKNFQPRIYYFNEIDGMLEELPDQEIRHNSTGRNWASVTATTTHFSTYILINSVIYNKEWYNQVVIRKPQKTVSINPNFDVIFVIDESNSMENMQNSGGWFNFYTKADNNDPGRIRVSATKRFIEKMSSKDRAGLVGFWQESALISPLTLLIDKNRLKALVDNINGNSPGTALYKGLETAINEFRSNPSDARKIIIALTDGEDSPQAPANSYETIIKNANDNDITIYTIGLGKTVNNANLTNIANKTGGLYYSSTRADLLTGIFDEVIEDEDGYFKDSNRDGISDYYAKLLTEGKLKLSTGSTYLNEKGIGWVNCDKDLDRDGLLNGDEIRVTDTQINDTLICVYVRMLSDPTEKDMPIKVFFNGKQIMFDRPPIVENNNVLTPLDSLAAALGYSVDFYEATSTYVVIKIHNRFNYSKLAFKSNGNFIFLYHNGTKSVDSLATRIRTINNTVLIPITAFGKALGLDTKWDKNNNVVNISDNSILSTEPKLDNVTSILYNGKKYPIIAPANNPVKQGKLETLENADLSVGGWKTVREITGSKFQGFDWGNFLGGMPELGEYNTEPDMPDIGYHGSIAMTNVNGFFLFANLLKQVAASRNYLYLHITLQENGNKNRAVISTGTNSSRPNISSLEMEINSRHLYALKNADAVLRNFEFLPLEKNKKYDLSMRKSYKWDNNTNNPYIYYVDFANGNKLRLLPKWYKDDFYYLGVIKFNVAVTISNYVYDLKALYDAVIPKNSAELMNCINELIMKNDMKIDDPSGVFRATPEKPSLQPQPGPTSQPAAPK
jgi:hypothetical protein